MNVNMGGRRRNRAVAEINVVPYIDVMMVLLIIFMVTAPIIAQGVKVDLPQADSQPMPEDTKPPIIAVVDAAGLFYLETGEGEVQSLSEQDLLSEAAAYIRLDPERPVVVKGDGSVPYEQVIRLMVLLQQAGAPSVGLMTQPDPDK